MTEKTRVLFATDFSQAAKTVTELIKFLQSKIPCDISYVHVIPSRWKEFWSSGLYKKSAFQRLESLQQKVSQESDKKKLHLEYGNAADVIVRLSQVLDTQLILIGGKGFDNRGRYKSGATLEAVVRHANRNVLVCKSSAIQKILCGIDGSANSAAALDEAIRLCSIFSASLQLVFVLSKVDFNPMGMDEEEILKQEEDFRQRKIAEMQVFLKQFDFTGIQFGQHFLWGNPANVILDMAEDFSQDLIVVGSKGHGLLHHVLIGSTTEKILRHTPCSLLVVPLRGST